MSLLHHIALGVTEVEAIAAFYSEIFGLAEHTRHQYEDGRLRSIWLDMGGSVLMIEHAKSLEQAANGDAPRLAKHPSDAVGEGFFLLTFSVADAAERRAVERRAEACGQPIESRSDYSAYFRDPAGNRVAVSHYPL